MTEAGWLACTNPTPMLRFLRGKASDRKLRLFACGCCRQLWDRLADERSRRAVEAAERYADGEIPFDECLRAADEAGAADDERGRRQNPFWAAQIAAGFTRAIDAARQVLPNSCGRELQAALLRDLFGNPFRPVAVDPAWLTWNGGTVPRLAQAIYDERCFDRLPILADALEDAGCHDLAILTHCRGPGPHVRGCWVVDALLGKK
jgi:hypothetical protein